MQSTTVISRPLLAKPASSKPFPPLLLLGRLSEKKEEESKETPSTFFLPALLSSLFSTFFPWRLREASIVNAAE